MLKLKYLEILVREDLETCPSFKLHKAKSDARDLLKLSEQEQRLDLYKRVVPLYRAVMREINVRDIAPCTR